MDFENKIDLIKRNTVEIVTEEELRNLLETKTNPITYTGYEPSGPIHLGHAVTIMKLRDLEKTGFTVKVLLADVHAILNKKGTEEEISHQCDLWEKSIKEMALEKPIFVRGSSFQFEEEYMKDIHRTALSTTIKRGLRSMQEVARDINNAMISQMIYPLMQAVDIKHLKVDVAQAGIEQRKIHMLARDIFESQLGTAPPTCVHTPLISSIKGPGTKMSSSEPDSLISVADSEEEIIAKMKKAYCPSKIVEENPVLQIAQLIVLPNVKEFVIERPAKFGGDLSFTSYEELEKAYVEGLHPLDLKIAIGKEVAKIFAPVKAIFEKDN
ncbi:MAG: tyrosine--tRNA ligase [Candidatus Kariarchaeaceae archaeon]